jgi:hypothetical protein
MTGFSGTINDKRIQDDWYKLNDGVGVKFDDKLTQLESDF